ncbi:hypothetical protein G9A89_002341 [Geosiphon pyriformis]|nr:hypothetical protein G9A89_002341 [Geosiphon pyriformis]
MDPFGPSNINNFVPGDNDFLSPSSFTIGSTQNSQDMGENFDDKLNLGLEDNPNILSTDSSLAFVQDDGLNSGLNPLSINQASTTDLTASLTDFPDPNLSDSVIASLPSQSTSELPLLETVMPNQISILASYAKDSKDTWCNRPSNTQIYAIWSKVNNGVKIVFAGNVGQMMTNPYGIGDDTVPFPKINKSLVVKAFFDAFWAWWGQKSKDFVQFIVQQQATQIYLTGFSLGGVYAEFCSLILKQTFPNLKTQVITFGEPRVGNQNYANAAYSSNNFRITHASDPVPHFPITMPHTNENYVHANPEYWIDLNNKARVCSENGSQGVRENKKCSNSANGFLIGDHRGPYFDVKMVCPDRSGGDHF